ncbi:MAG TPA: DUF695 domain-containing protein [Chitinophagaceae bacterium]
MFGIKKMTGKKENDPKKVFWNWFIKHEHRFKKVNGTDEAHDFLNELIEQINPFNPWLKALAGPYDDDRYELIITADGDIALFCKVEELVAAAPAIKGWIVTAHKPPIGSDTMSIEMHGYTFGGSNLQFYPVTDPNYPDEINIVLVHPDFNKDEEDNFLSGCQIYIQNAMGELNTATLIDSMDVRGLPEASEAIELIPMSKLNDYLVWREKEFVEKYATLDVKRPAESWGVLEANAGDENKPMLAVIDAGFKDWEYRSAYPWLAQVDIEFEGNEDGMPEKKAMEEMQQLEDDILQLLERLPSTFLMGHDTHDGLRSIYFYTDQFNEVATIINHYLESRSWDYKIVFHIRKDKYWKAMDYFFNATEREEDEDDDDQEDEE